MSHQPFEEWIFEDEVLPVEKTRMLQAHLEDCLRCRNLSDAWHGARLGLMEAEVAEPTHGFVIRWQTRQAEERKQAARGQVSWVLGLTILGSCVLALPIALEVISLLEAPAAVGSAVIREILSLGLAFRLTGQFMRALLVETTAQLPVAAWVGLGVTLLGFVFAWALSLYRFAFRPVE